MRPCSNHVPDRAEFFYAKCGCYRDLAATNPALRPRRRRAGSGHRHRPAFPAAVCRRANRRSRRTVLGASASCRCGGCSRSPSWLAPAASPNQGGIGDIRAGREAGVRRHRGGDRHGEGADSLPDRRRACNGLGTDHASIEPAFLLRNDLTPKVTLESQFGVWLPVGGAAPVPTDRGRPLRRATAVSTTGSARASPSTRPAGRVSRRSWSW